MKSKQYVKNISISDEAYDLVFFEGNLGETVEAVFVEGDVLEFYGSHGVLRVGISRVELVKALDNPNRELYLSSG